METTFVIAQIKFGIAHQLYIDGLITSTQLEGIQRLIENDIGADDSNVESSCVLPCVNR